MTLLNKGSYFIRCEVTSLQERSGHRAGICQRIFHDRGRSFAIFRLNREDLEKLPSSGATTVVTVGGSLRRTYVAGVEDAGKQSDELKR